MSDDGMDVGGFAMAIYRSVVYHLLMGRRSTNRARANIDQDVAVSMRGG